MFSSIFSSLNVQTILVAFVVILLGYKIRQRLKYRLPPGPWAIPFIGNIDVLYAKLLFEKCRELQKKYGPVFTIQLGPLKSVVLNDIDVVTEALVKKKADFANRPHIPSIYSLTDGGKNIVFANYTPTWKLHRKIAGKALRQYMADNHLEVVLHASMTKCLTIMAKETGPFNPEPYIDLMVFNILHAICFGKSCDIDDPEFQRFMKLDKDANEGVGNGFIEDMFPFLVKIWPTKKYTKIMGMFNELIDIIRKKYKEHEDTFDPDNIRDFTDTLILARKEAEDEEDTEALKHLTKSHLIQTIVDIFGAGIDTSRLTLYFAVRFMGSLPHIQKKVHEEIDRVVGTERLPEIEDRDRLSYTEGTFHEIMRLGTAVPMALPHSTICDTTVGKYDVPKDTMVFINIWALHRDSKHWKDPEKFDPTRFLNDDGKMGMKPESWLPFSAGRRVCLGETVAKPELHLIFASIMQRFEITLAEGTNTEMEYVWSGAVAQPTPFQIKVRDRTL